MLISSPHFSTIQESPPFRKLFAKMHVSLSSEDKAPKVLQNLFKVSLADASVHEFPAHLRDHLVMEAVTIARFV